MDRPTFSPFWHRVATTKPRLRPHVQVTRQHYRRGRWHVVHDPASNQFYRLNPVAHDFVASLDGARTVDEAWQLSLGKHADAAPTQNEIIELLSQLYSSNLLTIDASPEAEQLLRRNEDRASRRRKQQLASLMYLRIKVFNPDAMLDWLLPIFRPLLTRAGAVLWFALIIYAIWSILPEWHRLAGGFDQLSNPANWGWMILVYVVLKAWHELGHGIICKRFGGQVPEMGFLLMIFLPSPFVDASSAWTFDSKWKRALVGAGGMIFELTAAAVAALIYVHAPEGTLLREVCFYAMLTSSVSTLFFNGNPLMRFDGYFILSDLIEVPNLMNRSTMMLKFLAQRHLYRLENVRPPTASTSEALILLVFGIASLIYRVFLFVVITFYVLNIFFIVGLLLAVWSVALWFIGPIGAFVHWIASNSALADRRGRAVLTSLALAATVALLVGVLPLPDWRRVTGVVEPTRRSGVFVSSEGFVARALVRAGERVKEGDAIVVIDSPEIAAQIKLAEANIKSLQMDAAEARSKNDPPSESVAISQANVWRQSLDELRRRLGELVVRAPIDGVLVGTDPARLVGAYVQVGAPVCEVVGVEEKRVSATLSQGEASWLFELPPSSYTLRMRAVSDPWRVINGTGAVAIPAAQAELPHAALGAMGGGEINIRHNDPRGRSSQQEQFVVRIEADAADLRELAAGQRVYISASLPSRPLLQQIIDRLAKALQGRVNL